MMKTMLALLAALILVAGCNTVRGIGQDMKQAGEKIEDAAKKK